VLDGGNGNDSLNGGDGADTLAGGSGIDTAVYNDSDAGVGIDLSGTTAGWGGDAAGDALTGIENVTGSNYGDWLGGDNGANTLNGGNGLDWLHGHERHAQRRRRQ
jgi:Ca2+-binding RTX toxin-like protein